MRLKIISKMKYKKNNDVVEKINKCLVILEYIDMILIALLAIYGGIGILYAGNKMAGIVISVFTSAFSVFQGIIKKLLKETKKKKKHDEIIILAKNKSNNIKNLISEAIIDLEISHEEFQIIVDEKNKYDQMEESIRNTRSRNELTENSENAQV